MRGAGINACHEVNVRHATTCPVRTAYPADTPRRPLANDENTKDSPLYLTGIPIWANQIFKDVHDIRTVGKRWGYH